MALREMAQEYRSNTALLELRMKSAAGGAAPRAA